MTESSLEVKEIRKRTPLLFTCRSPLRQLFRYFDPRSLAAGSGRRGPLCKGYLSPSIVMDWDATIEAKQP